MKRAQHVPPGAFSVAFWNHELARMERAVEDRRRDVSEAEARGDTESAETARKDLAELEAKLDGARRLTRDLARRRERPDALLNIPFGVGLGMGAYLFQWAFFWGLAISAGSLALWYFATGRTFRYDKQFLFNRHLLGVVWMLGAFAIAFVIKR